MLSETLGPQTSGYAGLFFGFHGRDYIAYDANFGTYIVNGDYITDVYAVDEQADSPSWIFAGSFWDRLHGAAGRDHIVGGSGG